MPIYEYACGSCGARFEVLVSSRRDGSPACPDCGAGRCRKAFSAFAMGGVSRRSSGAEASSGSSCTGCSRSSCRGCR